jgi:hypothetical protein
MNREPDQKIAENPRQDEDATGTVLRLVPRAERERKATRTVGRSGTDLVQKSARDGDDDDPGPSAA